MGARYAKQFDVDNFCLCNHGDRYQKYLWQFYGYVIEEDDSTKFDIFRNFYWDCKELQECMEKHDLLLPDDEG